MTQREVSGWAIGWTWFAAVMMWIIGGWHAMAGLVAQCTCRSGCPGCVEPALKGAKAHKEAVRHLIGLPTKFFSFLVQTALFEASCQSV